MGPRGGRGRDGAPPSGAPRAGGAGPLGGGRGRRGLRGGGSSGVGVVTAPQSFVALSSVLPGLMRVELQWQLGDNGVSGQPGLGSGQQDYVRGALAENATLFIRRALPVCSLVSGRLLLRRECLESKAWARVGGGEGDIVQCVKFTEDACGLAAIPAGHLRSETRCSRETHRQCEELPGGAGVEGADLVIYGTAKYSSECRASEAVLVHATSCQVDQHGSAVAANVNFCPGRLRLDAAQDAYQLSETLKALKVALGFEAPVPGPWDDFQAFLEAGLVEAAGAGVPSQCAPPSPPPPPRPPPPPPPPPPSPPPTPPPPPPAPPGRVQGQAGHRLVACQVFIDVDGGLERQGAEPEERTDGRGFFSINHGAGWSLGDSAFERSTPAGGPVRLIVKPGGACRDAGSGSPLRVQLQAVPEHRRVDIATTLSAQLLETRGKELGRTEADGLAASALGVPDGHLRQGHEYDPVQLMCSGNMSAAETVSRLAVGQNTCHHVAAFLAGAAEGATYGASTAPASGEPSGSESGDALLVRGFRVCSAAMADAAHSRGSSRSLSGRSSIDLAGAADVLDLYSAAVARSFPSDSSQDSPAKARALFEAARLTREANEILLASGTQRAAGATLEIRGAVRYARLSAAVYVSHGSLADALQDLGRGHLAWEDFVHLTERAVVLAAVDAQSDAVPASDKRRALERENAAAGQPSMVTAPAPRTEGPFVFEVLGIGFHWWGCLLLALGGAAALMFAGMVLHEFRRVARRRARPRPGEGPEEEEDYLSEDEKESVKLRISAEAMRTLEAKRRDAQEAEALEVIDTLARDLVLGKVKLGAPPVEAEGAPVRSAGSETSIESDSGSELSSLGDSGHGRLYLEDV